MKALEGDRGRNTSGGTERTQGEKNKGGVLKEREVGERKKP